MYTLSTTVEELTQIDNHEIERYDSAIIWEKNGHVLLAQRAFSKKYRPGMWHFPGGKIDPEEAIETVMGREIKEELQVENIQIIQLVPKYFDYMYMDDHRGRTIYTLIQSKDAIITNEESDGFGFFAEEEMRFLFEKTNPAMIKFWDDKLKPFLSSIT